MTIDRFFSKDRLHPFDELRWTTRTASIGSGERVIFQMENVEAPESWSQLAIDIAAAKYFRKAGVPEIGHETSVKQLIYRVVHTIAQSGIQQEYFDAENGAVFESELTWLLTNQYGAFNSPVWFNCGLWQEYKIAADGGNWAWDEESQSVIQIQNNHERPQCSACFIQGVDDSLDSMTKLQVQEVIIFKYGSGSGTNFSRIRAKKEPLSGGGESSGVISFLEAFDRWAASIKSGGTTRRAAKIVILDIDHPEILDFINWKSREEAKAQILIAGGYGAIGDINSEAYRTISGQNANNSVRIPDEFMHAYLDDKDWATTYRTSQKIAFSIKARELMRKIAESAWTNGDPGVQFSDNINGWHTCPKSNKIRASNPCSEFMFLDGTACNLASLNLVKFLDAKEFDTNAFEVACRIFFLAQEILVDFAGYPTEEIAKNSHDFRPLGLGYANLGALLMRLGLGYASDAGRKIAAEITSLMSAAAYRLSTEIAQAKGPFPRYAENRSAMIKVMELHQKNSPHPKIWEELIRLGYEHGFRNSQATLLAPTGTIGFMMDCDTTGVEPDFALIKKKKLAGGGVMLIPSQSLKPGLKNLGYDPQKITEIMANLEKTGKLNVRGEHCEIFHCAHEISPLDHLRMMAAVQPLISGGISKTVNLSNGATIEEIEELYVEAWRMGLKSVAIYRDGSKSAQPLNFTKKESEKPLPIRRRLPDERPALCHKFRVGNHEGYLHVGLYEDGTPGEIFLRMAKEGSTLSGMMDAFATMTSVALQYGVPLKDLVRKFSYMSFDPYGWTNHPDIPQAHSLVDYIFRWLKLKFPQLMNDGSEEKTAKPIITRGISEKPESDGPACFECGAIMVRNGTCYRCLNCGSTSGCS